MNTTNASTISMDIVHGWIEYYGVTYFIIYTVMEIHNANKQLVVRDLLRYKVEFGYHKP